MSKEKEWNPDEPDPVELQKRHIEIAERFLAKLEAQEAEEKRRREEYEAGPRGIAVAPAYTPPTFEEISVNIKKAWDEVERIIPAAPEQIKVFAWQTLAGAANLFRIG